ncbi:15393_t:CDS:2 [Entrophospora sp. SA101]|nr:15393_t:CDS:2 [Entrophospora sp. SA101]
MSKQNAQVIGYGGGETDDYSSDSDVYSDNISESGSENCSDYGSDYESDTETSTIKSPISQPPNIEKQMSNSTNSTDQVSPIYPGSTKTAFTKRQEKFDDKFTSKGLLNKIREIASSPARDLLDKKGSLEDVYLWDYLLPNHEAKSGISLYDAYKRDELTNRLVIQVEQDNGWNELDHTRVQPPSNAEFEIRPLLQKYSEYLGSWDIEEKNSQWYVYFNWKAYLECPQCKRLHEKDQRWYGHAYGNGSFIVKCFQQNRDESGEIFNDPSIAEKIQRKNKNNIPPPVIRKVKGPKFPWPFLEMPAWVNCDSPLTAREVYEKQYVEPLPKEGDVYVGSPWETGKTYTLEHLTIPDGVNLLALSTRHTYSSAVTTRLNLKSYCDIDTKDINLPDHQRVVCQIESLHRIINKCKCEKKCKCPPIPYDLWLDEVVSVNSQAHTRLAGQSREQLYKLIQEARRIIVMDNDLTDLNIDWIKSLRKGKQFSVIHNTYQPQKGKLFHLSPNKETLLSELWNWARKMSALKPEERKSASVICHLRYDLKGIVSALRDDFPELRIKEYHGESDPVEKAQDFSDVEEAWKDVDIVAYTSTLKIGVSCTNTKFERAFCLFKSNIETNAGTNQMLFRMRCIKEYTCHIEQRSSNLPITEQGLFHWLLKAKRECLPQELQNRGIFPDVESIIRNKDIPTVRLWAGMLIDILDSVPLPKDVEEKLNSLKNKVDVHSIVCKAKEEKEIANANIINHETAEVLENKPKKTLEEMRALKRFHIAECYGLPSESLTEEFIADYGRYDEMKWFRNLRKLRDAGTDNGTAVEAIVREDYRNDRLITVTQAEKHRICLELLKTCTPVKDIDDRNNYKVDEVRACLNSSESIQYLQNLVPKMARVFDNTDSSWRAKKSGLKSDKAKLGLLNSALSTTYGIKLKASNKKNIHYHLVGSFNSVHAPKLPPYQTNEGPFYENGEDIRYGYSKLSPDELEPPPNSISQNTQDLFDIV